MSTTSVSSIQPNLRFGTSFLDTKYRERGVNGEVLMDKRTGEIAFKRVSDGSIIYFDRENLKLDDYITQISALKNTKVDYEYPSKNNMEDISDTFFMTTLIDLQNFTTQENGEYSEGNIFTNDLVGLNDSDGEFTFSQEMNGIFLNLMARPRDLRVIDFCSAIYNELHKDSKDDYIVSLKSQDGFEESDAKVEYIVTVCDMNYQKTQYTKTAYVRLNQFNLSLFNDINIKRNNCKYATIKIKSVCLHKLTNEVFEYIENTPDVKETYSSLLDDSVNGKHVIALTHLYVGSFITNDVYLKLPTDYDNPYNRILSFIQLPAFESALDTISKVSYRDGVYINPAEPSKEITRGISLWVERFRNVYAKGETEKLEGSITDIDEIENLFGRVETIDGNLTEDSTDLKGFFVGLKNKSGDFIQRTQITKYTDETLRAGLQW